MIASCVSPFCLFFLYPTFLCRRPPPCAFCVAITVQAIFHPDTGEKIPMPFRMSGEGVSMPLTCVSVCQLAVCSLLPAQETWQNGRRAVWTERLGKVTLSWILIKAFGSCCLDLLLGLSEIGVF